ncbi:TraR/DksA C4-type zinc finger protein [Sphingomonas sp. ERG5]|uniref:TraR/DksA C4-type zinc finger protein n=1 Tax=Sphingomonas sp. ERG5 TaxID=1381597 RepID=UPI00054BB2EC|nr:TraR/DksA C4-type zinc finger protein [Sphingomonas sp. ERG5]
MQSEERSIESSEQVGAAMRDSLIAGIRAGLAAHGRGECLSCGEEIEAARRAALPSAVRCVRCQDLFERRGK